MKSRVDHQATITDCGPETLAEIRKRLTFDNPAYLENVKRNFSNWQTPRLIECFDSFPGGLSFPRGFTGQACRIAKLSGEQVQIDDQRRTLPPVNVQFTGCLLYTSPSPRDRQKSRMPSSA